MSWDGPSQTGRAGDYAPSEVGRPGAQLSRSPANVASGAAVLTSVVAYFTTWLPTEFQLWVPGVLVTFAMFLYKAAGGFWKRRISGHRLVVKFEAATGQDVWDELPEID